MHAVISLRRREPKGRGQALAFCNVASEHCSERSEHVWNVPNIPNVPNKVMFRTMFRTFLGTLRTCGQDQHAQAQHWLRQAQLMHAQHWPRTQMRTRQGGGSPPLALNGFGSSANAEHAELSLSMPEPMLSLSMLILATYPVAALEGTIRNQSQNPRFQHFDFGRFC